MGTVTRRPDSDGRPPRWLARWRESDGTQRKKSFAKKGDAERYLTQVEGRLLTGDYVSPGAGKLTIGEWADTWLAAHQAHLKPSTRCRYEGLLREHILPRWGNTRLADVRHAEVAAWVSQLATIRSPGTTRQAFRVLSLMLTLAVNDGRIQRNPAIGVPLPKARKTQPRFLTHDEVYDLAGACVPARYGLTVSFLAYTGLRFGEMAALRVGDFDLERGLFKVHASITEVAGRHVAGSTKTGKERTLPIPAALAYAFYDTDGWILGRNREEYLFEAPQGGPLRLTNWRRRIFDPAVERAGLTPLRPHDLRHTAASLAIRSGASPKAVQRMLGHSSAAMTLDIYTGLYDDELRTVSERVAADAVLAWGAGGAHDSGQRPPLAPTT